MANILIAEHNETVANYLTATLKKAGHRIERVDNSLDAWRSSSRDEFDVMFVDVGMPGIDGFVLAQKALQENPLIQIVFVTGFAAVAMDTYATPSYAPAPVTTRPFHLKDINTRLRTLMSQGGFYEDTIYETAVVNDANATAKVIYANFGDKKAQAQT